MATSSPSSPPQRPTRRAARRASVAAPAVPKDPAIERALSLSTFEQSYSIEEFISTLSERVISESKSNPGPFDPKPFLNTFSPALDSLLALRAQVAERTKKMETDVRRAEREYGKRLRELDGGFEAIGSSFSTLETKIGEVGRTAVRIGEQLESLHTTRSTAQSTSLLIGYYLGLVLSTSKTPDPNHPEGTTGSNNNSPLESLFATRTSREGRARLAVILRRLMSLAKDVAENASTAVNEAEAMGTPSSTTGGTPIVNGAPIAQGQGQTTQVSKSQITKKRIELEKAERVRDEVERYCERFEKEVLRLFDRSYRKGDPRMMAHCAKTLQDFNGGASCVQIYVNQHDFFISKDKVLEEAEKEVDGEDGPKRVDIWKSIGDPDATAPTNEPGMDALFREIRTTVSQEAQIVKAVFPNPTAVMQVFLQRVFAQVIQQHLETLVSRAQAISTLAVLRILNLTHSACLSLVEDLKTYDAALAAPGSSNSTNAIAGPSSKLSSMATAPTSASGPLAGMLDHAMEEMFVPWLEGNRYLESESKNLVELYGGLLSRFARYHETVMKAKPNSLIDKVVNQLSNTPGTSSTSTIPHSTAQSAAAAIAKYANLFTSSAAMATASTRSPAISTGTPIQSTGSPTSPSTANLPVLPSGIVIPNTSFHDVGAGTSPRVAGIGNSPNISSAKMAPQRSDSIRGSAGVIGAAGAGGGKLSEEKQMILDGLLNPVLAERMLRWHAEAIGRVMELTSAGDVGKTALALSKVLTEALGRSYIGTALDSALAKIDTEPRSEPDLSPLNVLKPADQICHLWQRYTSTALLPLGGSQAVRREMSNWGQQNVSRMEGKINQLVQRSLDSIVYWLKYLLTKQKKNDYKPSNDEISFARNTTEPCQLCCEFIDHLQGNVKEGLSGKNAEGFLTEVGIAFHSLLLDHYKKFPVNPTGGLMLTKDLASYQEAVGSFGIPAVNDRFDMLRQLGNSFIVQPNVLKSYMTESHLGRIDTRLLRPYLAQRVDYNQFSRSLQLDDGTPLVSPTNNSTNSGGGLDLGASLFSSNTLNVMSGVAGSGMKKLKNVLKEFEVTPEELEAARKAQLSAQARGYRPQYYPIPMHM